MERTDLERQLNAMIKFMYRNSLGMCNFIHRYILLVLFCFLIMGFGNMPFPRCIRADYFGPEPTAVSAHFLSGDKGAFKPEKNSPDDNKLYSEADQVVRWKDTGMVTNGDDLVVKVMGRWASGNKSNRKVSKQSDFDLNQLDQSNYDAEVEEKESDIPDINVVCNMHRGGDKRGEYLKSYPPDKLCWFTNGHGAYFLFRRANDPDPNKTLQHMRDPASPTIHLGALSDGRGIVTLKKDDIRDQNGKPIRLEKGWKIYVKILDRYYDNNIGGYSLEFQKGVDSTSSTVANVFDFTYKFLRDTLLINRGNDSKLAVAQLMFEEIRKHSKHFVTALLVLFIIFSSLLHIFGMVKETKQDLLIRMMKIALVSVLISPQSWEFFYNYFLSLFVEGMEHLIKIVTNINTKDDPVTDNVFYSIGSMLNLFFSYSVWHKFGALWLQHPGWGFILLIGIIIGGILYFILCVYVFVLFMSGFVGLAFLIAMAPLFLLSILFSVLQDIFKGWIKFLISLCLQSVMLFTILSFSSELIQDFFKRQLGFTVCYNSISALCLPGGKCLWEKAWTPGQSFTTGWFGIGGVGNFTNGCFLHNSDENKEFQYQDYPCEQKGFRYKDYPFLDPGDRSDFQRIKNVQRGRLIDGAEILILCLISFLLFTLRGYIQELASNIAGGGYGLYNISSMYRESIFLKELQKMLKIPKLQEFQDFVGNLTDKIPSKFDKLAGGAAVLSRRIPIPLVGTLLGGAISGARSATKIGIETAKFITSPGRAPDDLEDKIFKLLGMDAKYFSHRRLDSLIDCYKLSVGSFFSYSADDLIQELSFKPHRRGGYDNSNKLLSPSLRVSRLDKALYNPFYAFKLKHKSLLENIHEYTVGTKIEPQKLGRHLGSQNIPPADENNE